MMQKAASDDLEGFFRCCGKHLLKKPSEDAEGFLNSASLEEVVQPSTYIHYSSYVGSCDGSWQLCLSMLNSELSP